MLSDGNWAIGYTRLKNLADAINHALKRNDRFSGSEIEQAVRVAREEMISLGISPRFCQTPAQVLDLLNTLYD